MLLGSIVLAGLMGGVLSVLVAGLLIAGFPQRFLPGLVGFAAGVLLGAATLHILPEAFEAGIDAHAMFATLLAGLIGLYALQRLALWRHTHPGEAGHDHHCHHPDHGIGRETIWSVVVGDGFHNFVDGVLIAAAFLTDPHLGWTTAMAVIAHEIPQEAGDFVVLRAAGLSVKKALLLNGASSMAAVAGGIIGYFALSGAQALLPYILTIAGASFLYIAVADLIPLLRRESARGLMAWQSMALLAGVGLVAVLSSFSHGH